MSKDESRRGSAALPTGQAKRGFPASNATNNKDKSAFQSIPTPADPAVISRPGGDGYDSITAGFPSADSRNAVKGGGALPNDDVINRGYTPNRAQLPSTRNTTDKRLRYETPPGNGS